MSLAMPRFLTEETVIGVGRQQGFHDCRFSGAIDVRDPVVFALLFGIDPVDAIQRANDNLPRFSGGA